VKRLATVIALLLTFTAGYAKNKDKDPELPALVTNARFVHVTTLYGDGFANPRISVEDRKAVAAMEQALRIWGRYEVTMHPKDADIILLVRAAARAAVYGGPDVTIGSGRPPRVGGIGGTEVSSTPDDMLAVYTGSGGTDSPSLWRRTARDGFGSDMALFKAFKKAVEDSTTKKP
jgi:hypothetical protein